MGSLRDIRREAHNASVTESAPPDHNDLGGLMGGTSFYNHTQPMTGGYMVGPTGPTGPTAAAYGGPVSPTGIPGQASSASRSNHAHPQGPQGGSSAWRCIPGTGTCGPKCPQSQKTCENQWDYKNVPRHRIFMKSIYDYVTSIIR
jgi:hypothetical protein